MLTGGEVAALIAAVAWTVLVAFLCVALVKLMRLLAEATKLLTELGERTGPILEEAADTVDRANAQLERMDGITTNVAASAEDVASVTALTRSVVTGPLVKVASLTYGLRQVLGRRRAVAMVRTRRRRVDA